MAGFEVHDLGRDVEMEEFIEESRRLDADLLCLSALMTTTMVAMKDFMPRFKEELPRTKILVGGAPLSQHLADLWGADGVRRKRDGGRPRGEEAPLARPSYD